MLIETLSQQGGDKLTLFCGKLTHLCYDGRMSEPSESPMDFVVALCGSYEEFQKTVEACTHFTGNILVGGATSPDEPVNDEDVSKLVESACDSVEALRAFVDVKSLRLLTLPESGRFADDFLKQTSDRIAGTPISLTRLKDASSIEDWFEHALEWGRREPRPEDQKIVEAVMSGRLDDVLDAMAEDSEEVEYAPLPDLNGGFEPAPSASTTLKPKDRGLPKGFLYVGPDRIANVNSIAHVEIDEGGPAEGDDIITVTFTDGGFEVLRGQDAEYFIKRFFSL